MDVLDHNRMAWDEEARKGNMWTIPVDPLVIRQAREGIIELLLTPTRFVPGDWYPDLEGADVLCLASGGGQQAPVFAAAKANVTLLDNSPIQLDRDRQVAERENLEIRLEQGDMRDLSRFSDASFDLIFHPVSNCFTHDVTAVWRECHRVLKKQGVLLAGFNNPLLYIFDFQEWDEHGKLVVRYKIPYSDIGQLPKDILEQRIKNKETLEFGHSLEDQIGGQTRAGLVLTGLYEDTAGGDLLDPHIKTFIATRAIKP
ncbi:MAG: class I SAM-dependent methyltransferase [Clostridia bacterium]